MNNGRQLPILAGLGIAALLGRVVWALATHQSFTSLEPGPFILTVVGFVLAMGVGGLIRKDSLAKNRASSGNEETTAEQQSQDLAGTLRKARGFDFFNLAMPSLILILAVLRADIATIIVILGVYVSTLAVALAARAGTRQS